LDIRVLPKETLYGLLNRFVRFEFPPVRDYEATVQLVAKGVLSPVASGKNLCHMPFPTIEKLAQAVVAVALGEVPFENREYEAEDMQLTLAYTLESLLQFDSTAICSEDRALINQHAAPTSWGGDIAALNSEAALKTFLWEQGYPVRWFQAVALSLSAGARYWINRKMALVFPWHRLLQEMPEALMAAYPRLARIHAMMAQLIEEIPLETGLSVLDTLHRWLHVNVYPKGVVHAPYEQVILVEGSTEALLMPVLLQATLGPEAAQKIRVTPVGGKNQMLEQYVTLSEQLTLPLGVLLDRDANAMEADLLYYQRPQDRIVILDEGEFEDLYAPEALVEILNTQYQPFQPVTLDDLALRPAQSRSRQLARLWPALGLGDFEKVALAHQMVSQLAHGRGVTQAMRQLVFRLTQAPE